jgi:thioredoxin reductase (NADPH)
MNRDVDCLIVGGGPAGLTAAIYVARFRLSVAVLDGGDSRAALIPRTHNHAGFPDGIAGDALLERMRTQAMKFGARIEQGVVRRLEPTAEGFTAHTTRGEVRARAVLLATGVTNKRPAMAEALHKAAVAAGRLRYCPVCDGFEVTDQRLAVIGTGEHGRREVEFLRGYSKDVTFIACDGPHDLSDQDRADLDRMGVGLVDGPVSDIRLEADGLELRTPSGRRRFDAAYAAMGSVAHCELAVALGAAVSEEGCLDVDAHQRTSVPGLYAAGDVVLGLDQISHAVGEAGVAATTIRNDLSAKRPIRR